MAEWQYTAQAEQLFSHGLLPRPWRVAGRPVGRLPATDRLPGTAPVMAPTAAPRAGISIMCPSVSASLLPLPAIHWLARRALTPPLVPAFECASVPTRACILW